MAHTASLDTATAEKLLSSAVAAPSIHNTQPWRFQVDTAARTVLLRAATERLLPEADPTGRALHVSAGAALLNLRVAAAHLGWRAEVRLLPAPGEPDLLAAVHLTDAADGPEPEPGSRTRLYDAVWRRHSSRFPFSNRQLPRRVVDGLVEAARREDAALAFPDRDETTRLLRLTAEAEQRNADDAARMEESRGWVREGAPYGLTSGAMGPGDSAWRVPMRDFGGTRPLLPTQVFERNPIIAVLTTDHDRRADWLRAGQALERTLLVATAHSVRTSLLHQALEWPDLRAALRRPPDRAGHVQMLVRLGYGPAGRPTPRRAARAANGPAGEGPRRR
ncbi:Acg family FMN-binding oxidoreductase [Streptomyces sp. 4N509B]|uniref:Acg family FMN-binding oxidoreductase n=1 Tax=Streptomyces sp. 4N509B TaxID=3457413 RepID=UPI003FCEFC60